jgi:sugar/nucleoside kinase (ribokinase family)
MPASSQKPTLLTVGSVAFDSVETPLGAVEKALGGSASYASLAASYFATPQVVAVVGKDFGDEHVEKFRRRGVDTAGLERATGETFHWRGRYHANLQDRDTLETRLNVFETFDAKVPPKFRRSAFVFLGNIAPGIQAKVLDQVQGSPFVGMDTMNFWISSALDSLKSVLRRVDMLFINDVEATQLTGERQVLNAAQRMLELGPKYVVIKRGEFGSLLFGQDICLFVPAVLLTKVVDPTGAGDAFAGGFLGALARAGRITRATLAEGMLYGTVMASFVVEAFSVDGLLDHTLEVINLRREFLESMTTYS